MAEEIDPAIIKKTQEILGSIIKKPTLTEKNLKKPPFRFLHDIITNIIKTSGFLKGLYASTELHSENVKDKESKVLFLQKAVDVLALVTNQPVNLKPSKVVAGHDPQKTNLFLQILGSAVKNKLDSKEAVAKVLSGNSQSSPTKAPKERRASVDKRKDKTSEKSHSRSLTKTLDPVKKSSSSSSQNKDATKSKDSDKSKDKSRESRKDREKSKDRSKQKTEDSKRSSKDRVSKTKDPPPPPEEEENKTENFAVATDHELNNVENHVPALETNLSEPSTSMMNGDAHSKDDVGESEFVDSLSEKPIREKSHRSHSSRSARPPSARSKRTKPCTEPSNTNLSNQPVMMNGIGSSENFENMLLPSFRPPSARPPSARPSSSRPAPPRIRVRNVVESEEPSLRPATAKPVENVILDQGQQSDEDEDNFIVMETEPQELLEVQTSNTTSAVTPDEDKGSLVKKLLETKKDLEGGSQHTPTKKVDIDRSQMSDVTRAHERDSASKELGQLRSFVQSLSKTAVPLGRMLDFLQEDLDSMKMELKMWREEHEQNLVALHKEQNATETLLEPLRAQLDDLDQVVQNQLDANSALKASIARNDERINRMLSSVNHKS
ncbi:TRAF3-interacting protein 1 isoform X2 [Parasteatoda tepidariorum]|uniref:TRAF3-interacting protein 1 isoform X2 n=1 Tax=Parasteatoda tepidariorum TaxID=114398 RepID=UPI001C724982|nr:TRAF3-interacting protein 1 isoform X2 [Parasteatoda tepidariorum]